MSDKNKKTLVLGGSENPDRYSNMAIKLLRNKGFDVVSIGNKKGQVLDVKIENHAVLFDDVHTITLYLGPKNQPLYYDYIFEINPQRIIFNPGTENEELRFLAETKGIETEEACTLVLLNLGQY